MNEIAVKGAFNPVALMPQTFGEKYQMAKVLSQSGLLPQGLNTPEKVCVALEWGHELQLSPMVAVNNIAVINGKPTLSADIMAAVAKRSPEYGGVVWTQLDDTAAECVVTRKGAGYEEKTRSRFTMEDAAKAGLAGKDVWRRYPRRMLKHRCLSYALRDAFPDILAGIYSPEEMEGVETRTERVEEPRNITAEATVAAAPNDGPELANPAQAADETAAKPEHAAEPNPAGAAASSAGDAADREWAALLEEARTLRDSGVMSDFAEGQLDAALSEGNAAKYRETLDAARRAAESGGAADAAARLGALLEKYEAQLGKNYETAYETYKTGSDGEVVEMYGRCVKYLGRKGIKVA